MYAYDMRKFLSSNKDFFQILLGMAVLFVVIIVLYKVFGPGGTSAFEDPMQ